MTSPELRAAIAETVAWYAAWLPREQLEPLLEWGLAVAYGPEGAGLASSSARCAPASGRASVTELRRGPTQPHEHAAT